MSTLATILPLRRRDLVIRPFGEDGQQVVKDPNNSAYYRLGPEEAFLFARLDGKQASDVVCADFAARFGDVCRKMI